MDIQTISEINILVNRHIAWDNTSETIGPLGTKDTTDAYRRNQRSD